MTAQVPQNAVHLMFRVYKEVFPEVHKELNYWVERAKRFLTKN